MSPFHFTSQPHPHSKGRQVVVPANLKTKAELFAFLARELPLPAYFGHNWDALEECLGELASADSFSLTLVHHDIPLQDIPADQRTYLHLLADIAGQSKGLSLVFPEDCHEAVKQVLPI